MARAKKLPHGVVDRRNGGTLALLGSDRPVPEMPADLEEAGQAAWTAYWASPMANLATEADLPVITRYAYATDDLETARREFLADMWIDGSRGNLVLNPLRHWISSREAEINKLEAALGLTPMARMQLGIAVGDAHRSLEDVNAQFVQEASSDDLDFDEVWELDA